ncbi:MAG: ParB/RepB/Spo0J family partition protein [Anaerolineales bacterium]|nr:ParB/RepB/Spo0J family partition protein [Anaerolineales bacterium]
MSEYAIWNELGNLHLNAGAYDDAIKAYRKALELESTFGLAMYNLAKAQARKGNYSEAISLYRRSLSGLEGSQEKAIAWNKLGDAHFMIGDYPNALTSYQKAVDLAPGNDGFQHDLVALRLEIANLESEGEKAVSQATVEPGSFERARQAEEQDSVDGIHPEAFGDEIRQTAEAIDGFLEPAELQAIQQDHSGFVGDVAYLNAHVDMIPGEPAVPQVDDTVIALSAPVPGSLEGTGVEGEPSQGMASSLPPAMLEEGAVREIFIDCIFPNPYQPRVEVDVEDLVDSVREYGIIQPLLATLEAGGRYVLIAGERRLEAARQVGMDKVPVIVRAADEQQRLELALVENVQRQGLGVLELAEAYRQLGEEFGLSHGEIARRVGRSRVAVTNVLRLLNLPDEVKRALTGRRISEGHARALLALPAASLQVEGLRQILAENLSVRQTEALVRAPSLAEQQVRAAVSVQEPTGLEDEVKTPDSAAQVECPTENLATPATRLALESEAADFTEERQVPPEVELLAGRVTESEEGSEEEDEDLAAVEGMDIWSSLDVPPAAPNGPPQQAEAEVSEDAVPAFESLFHACAGESGWMPLPGREVGGDSSSEGVKEPEAVRSSAPIPEMPAVQEEQDEGAIDRRQPSGNGSLPPGVSVTSPDEVNLRGVIATYKRVTEMNPENSAAWDKLGDLYSSLGQYEEAISAFQQAISVDASKEDYYYHLGQAYMAKGWFADAIRVFQEAVRLNPGCIYAHSALASSFRHLGRDEDARAHIEIVAPKMAHEKEYNQACFEAICGNVARALDLLRQSIQRNQTSVDQIRKDPDLALLHGDPRFDALMSEAVYLTG